MSENYVSRSELPKYVGMDANQLAALFCMSGIYQIEKFRDGFRYRLTASGERISKPHGNNGVKFRISAVQELIKYNTLPEVNQNKLSIDDVPDHMMSRNQLANIFNCSQDKLNNMMFSAGLLILVEGHRVEPSELAAPLTIFNGKKTMTFNAKKLYFLLKKSQLNF